MTGLQENILPGVEVIGAGYNPFAEYASMEGITRPIFDWNKAAKKKVEIKGKQYVVPTIVGAQSGGNAYYSNCSGDLISSFQSGFANLVKIGGGYNFFSCSLREEFNEDSLTKSENSFTRIQQSSDAWSLDLYTEGAQILLVRDALRADFRQYLDSLRRTSAGAEELFNTYGSHFLTGIVMGGRAVRTSATNKFTVDHSFSISVMAEAAYESMTGQISAADKAKYQQAIESFEANSESRHFVIGGLQPQRAFDGKGGFDEWSETVAEAPEFVEFVPNMPMAGIWYLCSDSEQADYLRDYYCSTWAPRISSMHQLHAEWVDDLAVVMGDSADVQAPRDFTRISVDLNEGNDGKFIYLCKHKVKYDCRGQNADCINDIKIIFGNAEPPAGYTKLAMEPDLNAGRGDFIYLCIRKVAYNTVEAIKDVVVISSSDYDAPPPYGFKKVPDDLNQGVGGRYIFVCTTTG